MRRRKDSGVVLFFVGLFLVVIIGFSAFALDLASALRDQRGLQAAADAEAFGGVRKIPHLVPPRQISGANGLNNLWLSTFAASYGQHTYTANCGSWDSTTNTFTPAGTPAGDDCSFVGGSVALQITTTRPSGTTFGRFLGINSIVPQTQSIAISTASTIPCGVIPFGVSRSLFSTYLDATPSSIPPAGFTFVTDQETGNWGKLNLDTVVNGEDAGKLGNNYSNAWPTGVCTSDTVPPHASDVITGNGQPSQMRNVTKNYVGYTMFIPIVNGFPTGNSSTVPLIQIIKATLISQNGQNGSGWSSTWQLVDWNPADLVTTTYYQRSIVY